MSRAAAEIPPAFACDESWEISFARPVIGAVTKHLHDYFRWTKTSARSWIFPPFAEYSASGYPAASRARLDYHFQPCFS